MGQALSYAAVVFQQPILLLICAFGVFLGIYVGVIPGLSGTMAVSLLVGLTFGWELYPSLALMLGVHVGAVYGGSRTAILLNIPGAPAAVATGFDGYPLAQKGKAGEAIGLSTVASVIGGFIGFLFLIFFAPAISKIAIKFASRDYLLLAFLGLLLVGNLGVGSKLKGLLSAVIGLMFGMVGMDTLTAHARFTFGNSYLLSGINYIVALIGLFGVSEVLDQVINLAVPPIRQKVTKIIPNIKDLLKHTSLVIRSSIIGVVVGALPGAGGDISSLIAYDQAKRMTRNPEVPFGEGAVEGLIAPEVAHSATIGGAYITMLSLGIPGDSVTAVMIGALMIHGLHPGAMFMSDSPNVFYLMIVLLIFANIFLLPLGLSGIKIFTKVVEVPKGILFPMIVVLSVVGTYAINNSIYDIMWMVVFGIIGYILKRFDFPTAPAVLGVILAGLVERNFRRAMIVERTLPGLFFSFFTHPISIVLVLITVFMFVSQSKWYKELMDRMTEKRTNRRAASK